MGSLCHLDSPEIQTDCIEKMIQTHLDYHHTTSSSTTTKTNEGRSCPTQGISITFHLLGGFLDPRGLSQALSKHVLGTLIDLTFMFNQRIQDYNNSHLNTSHHHHPVQWKLGTYAITSLNTMTINDDSKTILSPVGRGLALDVSSGKVFLVKMCFECLECDSIVPMYTLRNARLWFHPSRPGSLTTIMDMTTDALFVSPFRFAPTARITYLSTLEKDPSKLLEFTSTSPDCEEKEEYCKSMILTFRYVCQVRCSSVFGEVGQEKELKYQYVNDGWRRMV